MNQLFKLRSACVNILEQLWIKILLIVELSYLGLLIKLNPSIIMPIRASHLLEELVLELASFRLWSFRSLREEEG